MKTGKISTLIFAFALCFVAIFVLRVSLIPDRESPSKSLKNLPTFSQTTRLPDFDSYQNVAEKKAAFFNFLRPIVHEINQNNLKQRQKVNSILDRLETQGQITSKQEKALKRLAGEYGIEYSDNLETAQRLLKRIDMVPESLVLVQAANESGWGSSRFAKEGLNLFGQWCYSKGCGMVPSARSSGMSHEVTVFNTVEEAIASYIKNLNTHTAYRLFRSIRAEQRLKGQEPQASELVYGLLNYSERREEYVEELLQMLRHNQQYLEANNESDNQAVSAV